MGRDGQDECMGSPVETPDGGCYFVLVKGVKKRLYRIKMSAKKFSAQMEEVKDGVWPESISAFVGK